MTSKEFIGEHMVHLKEIDKIIIKQPNYWQPVYCWVIICQYWHFMHFWNFYFFIRIVNKCNNTDTENIKLIVLTFILYN